jgi:hypothetical protein
MKERLKKHGRQDNKKEDKRQTQTKLRKEYTRTDRINSKRNKIKGGQNLTHLEKARSALQHLHTNREEMIKKN